VLMRASYSSFRSPPVAFGLFRFGVRDSLVCFIGSTRRSRLQFSQSNSDYAPMDTGTSSSRIGVGYGGLGLCRDPRFHGVEMVGVAMTQIVNTIL
jgi:hypothetical protein